MFSVKKGSDQITSLLTFSSLWMAVLIVHGAVPFILIPTLGQAVWSMGFAQSIANQSLLSVYAIHFGAPHPAAMAFGLAGAFPASLLLRLGLNAADAYSLMMAIWLSVAFYGCYSFGKTLKLSSITASIGATFWLTLPFVWTHSGYSMLLLGIALLPTYLYSSLLIFGAINRTEKIKILPTFSYFLLTIIAVFMDGYTFMMFAVSSSFIGAYTVLFAPENRRNILIFIFPLHMASFAFSYFLFTQYTGLLSYPATSLNFFRGWGVDLTYLLVPSEGVHWLWDKLGMSVARSGKTHFGDASVWISTFSAPLIVLGLIAWKILKNRDKLATCFLLIALFGLYMGMGPSIKINSKKPLDVITPLMSQEYAVMPTGNSLIYRHVPGFKSMRASYRWYALCLLGCWFLTLILLSSTQKQNERRLITSVIALIIISNLPNLSNKIAIYKDRHSDFINIDSTIIKDMGKALHKDERVAFLPYGNDFFVNYIASSLKLKAYNIGGDKNLIQARQHWPPELKRFAKGKVNDDFESNIISLFAEGNVDAVVFPYIDLLWGAHIWPAPHKYKKELDPILSSLKMRSDLNVIESSLFSVIRPSTTQQPKLIFNE